MNHSQCVLPRYFVVAVVLDSLILFGFTNICSLFEERLVSLYVCNCMLKPYVRIVVKTALLNHVSIWKDLKRLWDIQEFINNHWPHEKLIHSGLENRHYFPFGIMVMYDIL